MVDILRVSPTTSMVTIEKLRAIFATHALPERIVLDNRTVLTSIRSLFIHTNGIAHT